MKRRKSIVNILYQNIIITLIFFVIIAAVVNGMVSTQLYKSAIKGNNVIAESIANRIQEKMQEPQRDIREMEQVLSFDIFPGDKVNQYLNSILKENPFLIAIEVLDDKGTVLNAAPPEFKSVGMDRSGEEFYKNLEQNGSFYWSSLFTLISKGEPTIAVSTINNNKIFVVYLNVQEISRISVDYSKYFGAHIQMFITDEKGTYISNQDKSMIFQRAVDKDVAQVRNAYKSNQRYFVLKAKNELVSVAFVENSRWYVTLYDSVDYIMAPIKRTYFLFYLFLGIVVMLSFIYYRKAKSLSESINQFSNQTRQIASGNFDIKMNNQLYRELHNLGENFDGMNKEIMKRDLSLEEFANIDSLTGLHNRRAIMKQIKENLDQNIPLAVVYFDLDQFKNINDSCGHHFGDIVLKQVSTRITECIDNKGILARIGGDEFLYVISGKFCEAGINETVEKIIESISEAFIIQELDMYIGVSAGIASYPKDASNLMDLMKFSDMAMYSAKNKGMNRYEYFTSELRAKFDRKMDIERQLRTAIAKNEFSCAFQPQIEILSGRIIGFEALIRWHNKTLGDVMPGEFIAIAEERNLMSDITRWVIKRSCEGILAINQKFDRSFRVSINVSVSDLKSKDFAFCVKDIAEQIGINPELIEIEITENMMIDNYSDVIDVIYQLKDCGMRISLDDFGKGYSSLSYLNRLPIDTLKIDREFLESSRDHEKGYQLIGSIIDIAKKLNFTVIAEGIETEEQLKILRKIDCYGGQGYLICRPVPILEVIEFIETSGHEI